MSLPNPILAALARHAERRRALRAAVRTERIFADLSPHIRKDIGWPDLWLEPRGRGR